ncbi:hypothetical protein BBJ28_00001799 [Nothophytophthora sp. Chile5]|nr:hypothetical protein BBJ28_00001799 [Nothophytophthora sp. Chile5]
MVVRPLRFASYKLQADENTLADVLTCFRDIFDGFITCEQRDILVPTIEKRWDACEQPLIMLALFLHPDHLNEACALPRTDVSGLDNMCKFATFYYQKLIGGDPLALIIHTAKRNRMSPEKAEKISVVRKLVRERDGKESPKKLDMSPDKRIVNPSEPEKLVGFGTPNRICSDPQSASPIGLQPTLDPEAESSPALGDTGEEESDDQFIKGDDPIGSWEVVFEGLMDSDDEGSGDDSSIMTFEEEDENVETTSRDG